MKGKILLSSTLAGMLFFAGCGSSSSSSNNSENSNNGSNNPPVQSTKTVSGAVVDGYIKGAKVCIDLNNNAQCDANEPATVTDDNGKYTLSYEGDINGKTVIAYGGFDSDRNVEFNATLENMIENGNANITPLTTFTYIYAKEKGISFDKAKEDVANILGIHYDEIDAIPVDYPETLEKISLKIQLAAEIVAKLKGTSPIDIYKVFANKASNDMSFTQVVNNAFSGNIKSALDVLFSEIDNTTIDNLQTFIKNLKTIQDTIVDIVLKANKNNITINQEVIANTVSLATSNRLMDLNLSESNFDNLIYSLMNKAYVSNDSLKVATTEDVKNLVQTIRDTTYEFLDPNLDNQENNTSTITGEVISNYNNAIKPAIDNLNSDINNSLDLVNKTVQQFDDDLDEFNQSLTDLNDRLSAIADIINEYNTTDEYNETTSYNDTISHTYSKNDNGYITETYILNGKTLRAYYYENNITKSFLYADSIGLSKKEEYNISLNSLYFDGNNFYFNINGVIYGNNDTSKKIEISNATLRFDVNTTQFDTTFDKALAFSNLGLNITGDVITDKGTFSGKIILFNAYDWDGVLHYYSNYLKGTLDYSKYNGVKLDGTLTINANTEDLLKIVNDNNLKYDKDFDLIFVDGSLVVKKEEYNVENNRHEENLTALNGEVAHCTITDNKNNNMWYHTVNCDKNVTDYNVENKMIQAQINNDNVILDNINSVWDNNTQYFYYHFKDSKGNSYNISSDKNITVSNITIQNPTTVLDIPGDIKFSGSVITPKIKLSLNLTTQSEGDGKTYNIIANDINITDKNNFASVDLINITQQQLGKTQYPYYLSYIKDNKEDNEDINTTTILLQGVNGVLYDLNNNPIFINNVNFLEDKDFGINHKYLYGNIAYLDFNMTGFIGQSFDYYSLYEDIQRNGYTPFTIGATAQFGSSPVIKTVIKKGNYLLYFDYFNSEIEGYDSNGVLININKRTDGDLNITITDKNLNSLATFDPKTNTITYNDGSSETLY